MCARIGKMFPCSDEWYAAVRGTHYSKEVCALDSDLVESGEMPKCRSGAGAYEMIGNVWEWVEDVWHEDYTGAPRDGSAWVAASDTGRRVQRGGSWGNLAGGGRVVNRNKVGPSYRGDGDGFRLARMLP